MGDYAYATRFSFQGPGSAGLDFAANGRGSNELVGRFTIHEVVYGVDDVITNFRSGLRATG